jgi:hypothetical protein
VKGKDIDPESKALWDDFRRGAVSAPSEGPGNPSPTSTPALDAFLNMVFGSSQPEENTCCELMRGILRAFEKPYLWTMIDIKERRVYFKICPQCGRKLQ